MNFLRFTPPSTPDTTSSRKTLTTDAPPTPPSKSSSFDVTKLTKTCSWPRKQISSQRNRKVGQDSEVLRRNRKHLIGLLKRLSKNLGKDLTLSKDGIAFTQFERFIIVIEVPNDHPDAVFLYTMVYELNERNANRHFVILQRAMELNCLQISTRGATIGLDREEVNLSLSLKTQGLTFAEFKEAFDTLTKTATEVNLVLANAALKL